MPDDGVPDDWVAAARRSYDVVADDYDRLLEGAFDRLPLEKALLAAFVELVGPGTTVVETGCGTGEVTRRLHRLGLRVVATDLAPGMLRVARRRDPAAALAAAALHALPLADASVDGAVCWYVLQHVPDEAVDAALAELHRVVRPGGRVLLAFHSGDGSHLKTEGYGGHPMRVHVHRRTAARVADRLRRNGFEISSTTETAPPPGSPSGGAVVLATR